MKAIELTKEEKTRSPYSMIPHVATFELDGKTLDVPTKGMHRAAALANLSLRGWDTSRVVEIKTA
jgi:hypothetical protein